MIREIDGELVALDTRANLVHQLNTTASLIWRLAMEGRGDEEITAAVVSEYAVDIAIASGDVDKLLRHLTTLRLLVRE